LLSYQYLQMLPNIAKGDANKVWMIPAEIGKALEGLGGAVSSAASAIPSAVKGDFKPPEKVDVQAEIERQNAAEAEKAAATVQKAIDEAKQLEKPPLRPGSGSLGQTQQSPALGSQPQPGPQTSPEHAGQQQPPAEQPRFAPPPSAPETETESRPEQ
ncbi:MAG TPA: SPFH/Band 7/PHB domain protein, partial [Microlunatus sp.]|nr:SPFH/Band 7/PHB domain protein [Microlunatus sp.]